MNVRGVSLVELLVAIAIISFLGGAFFFILKSSATTSDQLQLTSLLQEEMRAFMEIMCRDIRLAGSFPNGKDDSCAINCDDIITATETEFSFSRDLDGDGCCDGPEEQITYHYDGSNICRKSSYNSSCESFLGGLSSGDLGIDLTSFGFSFFDKENLPTNQVENIVYIDISGTIQMSQKSKTNVVLSLPFNFRVGIRNRTIQ